MVKQLDLKQKLLNMYSGNLVSALREIEFLYPSVYAKMEEEFSDSMPSEILDILFTDFDYDNFTIPYERYRIAETLLEHDKCANTKISELLDNYDYVLVEAKDIHNKEEAGKYIFDKLLATKSGSYRYNLLGKFEEIIDMLSANKVRDIINYQKLYDYMKSRIPYCNIDESGLFMVWAQNE